MENSAKPENLLPFAAVSPAEILEVAPEAGEEELRAAYLRKVRQYPPDRTPAEFEAVRAAYETLRDPRQRARAMLVADNPWTPLTSRLLGDSQAEGRHFVGPAPWLELLKVKK